MLRHGSIPSQLKSTAFEVLGWLCGTFQRLPDSYLVDGELKIDDEIPLAMRRYVDLWKGDWKGERVVVKFVRFPADGNGTRITKVLVIQAVCSHPAVADAFPLCQRFCKGMVLWMQLRHANLLPFYGAYMVDRLGTVSPWLENGNIVGFTTRNPEVNRLQLVRCG